MRDIAVLDEIDREILRRLGSDARMTQSEVGRLVGLSPNAAGARIQKLVDRGVIRRFSIEVDQARLGRPIEALIDVWQDDKRDREAFHRLAAEDERIVECVYLTGPLDFRVRARVASPEDLNDLLVHMQANGGVRQTDSRLVLDRVPTS